MRITWVGGWLVVGESGRPTLGRSKEEVFAE
jgi:hypothetical protein